MNAKFEVVFLEEAIEFVTKFDAKSRATWKVGWSK